MELNITDFGACPNSATDTSFPAYLATQELQRTGANRLVFEPGVYHFRPDRAFEMLCWISNHDSGRRRIGLPLLDLKDLTIQAEGATFIFHGKMIPVWLGGCRNVTWIGGKIDWEDPLHFEAEVTQNHRQSFEFNIREPGAALVRKGQCFLTGEDWEDELHDYIFFDPTTRRVLPGTEDHFCNGWFSGRHYFAALGGSRFRITPREPLAIAPPLGTRMILQGGSRDCPGVVIDECAQIDIDHLIIRHSPNMGILGQNSTDVRLQRVEIAPDPGSGRLLSTGNDATHFVGCAGHIELIDCHFQGMLDDATNVHSHYPRIVQQLAPDRLLLQHGHRQQRGFRLAAPGEQIALVNADTLGHECTRRVTDFIRINDEYGILIFDTPINTPCVGGLIENLSHLPNLTITGCHFSGNRARGMLIATSGDVVIENNHIAAPGAGIAILPDCNFWYESGPTRNVIIRRNTFDGCLSSPGWGDAVVLVQTELKRPLSDSFLHGRIRVTDNIFFLTHHPRVLQANSVAELTITGNRLYSVPLASGAAAQPFEDSFSIRNCGKVVLDDNGPG